KDASPRSDMAMPISRWKFDGDARDSIGQLHGTLRGPAAIRNGRLVLNGQGAFVETAALTGEMREKTLEAWVALPDLTQRGGAAMSLQNIGGGTFDAIVFGERQPGRWMAGSEGFQRSRDHDGAVEKSASGNLVHVAIVYARDNRITIYRNGRLYFG